MYNLVSRLTQKNRVVLPEMNLYNSFINWVLEAKYLGVTVCSGLSFMNNVHEQRRKFCGVANKIIFQGKGLSEEIIMQIIKVQAFPILLYVCEI